MGSEFGGYGLGRAVARQLPDGRAAECSFGERPILVEDRAVAQCHADASDPFPEIGREILQRKLQGDHSVAGPHGVADDRMHGDVLGELRWDVGHRMQHVVPIALRLTVHGTTTDVMIAGPMPVFSTTSVAPSGDVYTRNSTCGHTSARSCLRCSDAP